MQTEPAGGELSAAQGRGLRLRHDVTMARLHDVVIDSRHPASIARFWAAVLDGYQVAPYDEAEFARLRDASIFGPRG